PDLVLDHGRLGTGGPGTCITVASCRHCLGEFPLEPWLLAVFQPIPRLPVLVTLGALSLDLQVIQLLLHLADPVEASPLPVPARNERSELFFEVSAVGAQPLKPFLASRVR